MSSRGQIGDRFEKWLKNNHGGEGPFTASGSQFDGKFTQKRWYEAKSGRYWMDRANLGNPAGLHKFKSDFGVHARISNDHGATLELHSNTPIPREVKDWMTEKGFPFFEHLE